MRKKPLTQVVTKVVAEHLFCCCRVVTFFTEIGLLYLLYVVAAILAIVGFLWLCNLFLMGDGLTTTIGVIRWLGAFGVLVVLAGIYVVMKIVALRSRRI